MKSPAPQFSLSRQAYKRLPASKRVLVALMNNKRDLEIAREQGWYRIPVQSAPQSIDAARLAFYQTSAFKDEKWAVRYWAQVKSRKIVTRAELLPEESNHPRAEKE